MDYRARLGQINSFQCAFTLTLTERCRLPFGHVHRCHHCRHPLTVGTSLVCSCHSICPCPHQQFEERVGVHRSRRKTTVPWMQVRAPTFFDSTFICNEVSSL